MSRGAPRLALLGVVVLFSSSATAGVLPFSRLSLRAAARVLRDIHASHPDFSSRVRAISRRFVGTPYRFSPLGEGASGRFDRDPVFSLRRVDCLTLVEQVLAMAHSPSLDEARRLLQRIRYRSGVVEYRRRHHFAMSQWIPENQALGVLRDITASVGGTSTLRVVKEIDRNIWRGRFRKWRRRLGPFLPTGRFALPVIPINEAIRTSERFPDGALVSIVRVDRPAEPDPISHQGIVVVRNGRRYLRHASSGFRFRRVVDYPLRAYLRFSRRYFHRRGRRSVLGVNLQRLQESPALLTVSAAAPGTGG